jgi:hypothetical protein
MSVFNENHVCIQRGNMRSVNVAILATTMAWAGTASSSDDEFKQAVNYVFSGNPEGKTPQLLSEVVDQNECIVSVETPGHSWVYYMKEIKSDSVVIDEQNGKVSFAGDNTIVEHTFEGFWPASGSEDTELGVLMELEVGHEETEVYPRVQA